MFGTSLEYLTVWTGRSARRDVWWWKRKPTRPLSRVRRVRKKPEMCHFIIFM